MYPLDQAELLFPEFSFLHILGSDAPPAILSLDILRAEVKQQLFWVLCL